MKLAFILMSVASCLLCLAGGCNKPSPSKMVDMAFNPLSTPDERREGINMLATNSWGRQEQYLKGYATVLRLDTDPTVRSAAVKALAKSGNTAYVPQVAAALEDKVVDVRRDAADALNKLVGPEAADPLRRHAAEDSDIDVRALCLRALQHYPCENTRQTLLRCLGDAQFTIRYPAHQSLVALTGQDYGYNPEAWPDSQSGK